ncbi:hypothetical protein HPB50_020345 [Hyalomma asiaticum]|uniref:Uncharacterized protein n=1 Tax=Hyalomma asiaticum TaxID=266040 RepID=A0ACB7SRQ7_HYAAI|nr:hypothetical protein HPB50_020345 [Hyalomma asiaticum]
MERALWILDKATQAYPLLHRPIERKHCAGAFHSAEDRRPFSTFAFLAEMLSLLGGLVLIVLFVATLFRWRQRHFSYFRNLGIPGPEPSLLWGNIREYHQTHHYKVLGKWLEKYGDTFGFYDGDVPFIVTKDLDFLEYVLVRNFQNFTDRGDELVMEQRHPFLGNAIVYAEGTKWRNIRRSLAPCFTTAKLKQMMTDIKEGADIFLDIVGEQADGGREANVLELYQRLTMDYVGRGAFGVDCRFQRGPENALAASAKAVVRGVMTGPFHMICQSTSTLGAFAKPLYWINMLLGVYVSIAMTKETATVIDLRKKNPEFRKPDVLQSILDAEYQEDGPDVDNGTLQNRKGNEKATKSRVLTKDEVLLSAAILFIAGYETTSTALSYVTYILAKHQDVQDRVRREVNGALSDTEDMDYDTLTRKLPYLTQVVSETLRLYPPILTFISRKAVNDFEYNGIPYKAGTCIMSPTIQIHRDARYWPDPLKFNPDRFSPENDGSFHRVAYQAFGVGPRNCIGMRMAQMSLYYTIARLIQRFQLHLGPSQGEVDFSRVADGTGELGVDNHKLWRQRHFSYFRTLGIPGPEPSLLWGNIREYHATHHHEVIDKWLEEYDDTFGFYDGDVPFVVTKDLDFLEYILIRNFQNFTDRGDESVMEQRHPFLGKAIIYAGGIKWRNLRRSLAPCFATAKLKLMMTDIKNGADIFLDIAGEHADIGHEVNVLELYQRLTTDYIGRGAFGVDYRFQRGPENALAASAKGALRGIMTGPFHFICPQMFLFRLEIRKPDILQSLLDVEYEEESPEIDTMRTAKGAEKATKSRVLTKDEVLLSAAVFFVAGFVSRKAVNGFEYNGVHYKAGTCFMSPTLQIHRDARYWPDPHTFNPDRFAPENEGSFHKVAHQPFGVGPRNCIGMRMGQMSLYYTIARLIRRFELQLGPSHGEHHYKVIDKWLQKYGDTFGFYDGDVPFIVTKDLDFLEYVLVRNFQNFTDRGMMADLKKGADIYLDIAGEHAELGREVNVYELYQRLTMDYVVARRLASTAASRGDPKTPSRLPRR